MSHSIYPMLGVVGGTDESANFAYVWIELTDLMQPWLIVPMRYELYMGWVVQQVGYTST